MEPEHAPQSPGLVHWLSFAPHIPSPISELGTLLHTAVHLPAPAHTSRVVASSSSQSELAVHTGLHEEELQAAWHVPALAHESVVSGFWSSQELPDEHTMEQRLFEQYDEHVPGAMHLSVELGSLSLH